MKVKKHIAKPLAGAAVALMSLIPAMTSCEAVKDGLDPCPQGLSLRFVYDYNMEYANAFPSQVDCLTVLFYDENGRWTATRTNATSELADENYRMDVDLEPGKYTVVAYGGMLCDNASFSFTNPPEETPLTGLEVKLDADCLTSPVGTDLHPLFYGRAEVEVSEDDMDYRQETVYMMKDTNNLRIILQQIDGDPLDNADFDFTITDNNTLFGWNNDLLPVPEVTYQPWSRGNASPGELADGAISQVAWAELSFPRLMTSHEPHLRITRREDGYRIVDIPLNNYLLLMKSEAFKEMPPQEYLDRESRWSMIFFLDRNHLWLKTQIIINDWVVRLNDIKQ